MGQIIVLDSGPLGLISNPSNTAGARQARSWVDSMLDAGARFIVPEIADYEVRRELLRAGKARGIDRLDAVGQFLGYAELSTGAMRKAAQLWAEARNAGHPTAIEAALDADVILAAQALVLTRPDEEVIVATTNPAHLARYVDARVWNEID